MNGKFPNHRSITTMRKNVFTFQSILQCKGNHEPSLLEVIPMSPESLAKQGLANGLSIEQKREYKKRIWVFILNIKYKFPFHFFNNNALHCAIIFDALVMGSVM